MDARNNDTVLLSLSLSLSETEKDENYRNSATLPSRDRTLPKNLYTLDTPHEGVWLSVAVKARC